MLIASPSGSYYKEGINPVGIMIEEDDVRTVRGGTGYAKCGGNYAASTRAGERAMQKGYSQVLWLDGVERKYVEEVGAMNVMFKIGGEIVTPKLTGSILPGVTRKSCIEVLKSQGYKVTERLLSLSELLKAMEDGKLEEAWGCGTAAVVSPIGKLAYGDKEYVINGGKIGEVTQKLYDVLTGIQWGKTDDPFGWVCPV
jgi:branched-chain amino acid aminotransferase